MNNTLPRKDPKDVPHSLCMGADRPSFEEILPQMKPLFIYAGKHGRDKVRWEMSRRVARHMGLGEVEQMVCECCGERVVATKDSIQFDIEWDDIAWWFAEKS